MIRVTKIVAEIDYFLPFDLWLALLDVVRQASRRLANDLKKPFGEQPQSPLNDKLLPRHAIENRLDFCNGFADIKQSVLGSWRHLDHLNEVVGDPLGNTWCQ